MHETEIVMWDMGRDGAAYRAQWAADDVGLPYLSPSWLRGLCEGMGQDIRMHAVLSNGRMMAVTALRRASRYGVSLGRKPWATAYNAWTTSDPGGDLCGSGLLMELTRRYSSVRCVFAPGSGAPSAVHKTWMTLVLDVDDVARCWAGCHRHARQRVRKARELGVEIALSENDAAFEELYRLTYQRQGLSLSLPVGAVARTIGLARGGDIELYLATTRAGEPAAGLVVGWDRVCAYFMLAASHPGLRRTDAVSLLWWTVVEEACRRVSRVDLVGAATPEIERFKRSFSPTPVDCLEVVCEAWPWRLAQRLLRGPGRQVRV